jgi:hypothetical protein
MEEFCRYHIPYGIMKLKADKFHNLKPENKTLSEYIFQFTELSCYGPELVNTDAKKQTKFIEGLTYELRTLMTPQIYLDFNTLMNRTILTDVSKTEERKENKHKFLEHKVQGVRSQRQKTFSQPSQELKPQCSFALLQVPLTRCSHHINPRQLIRIRLMVRPNKTTLVKSPTMAKHAFIAIRLDTTSPIVLIRTTLQCPPSSTLLMDQDLQCL